jgi:hypothetical protein
MRNIVDVVVLAIVATPVRAQGSLPDPQITPGAMGHARDDRADYVQAWLDRTTRPPREYIDALKRHNIAQNGYADRHARDYEEDHPIPLSLANQAPRCDQPCQVAPRW